MGVLKAKKRNALPKSDFADPADRKYPMPDKAHADNAAARLEQQKSSMSSAKYKQIKSKISAKQRSYGEKPKKKALSIRGELAKGSSLHVRHMFDGAETTIIRAGEAVMLAALNEEGPVWNQIAKRGAFRGHPQGPFVIDERTLSEIVSNFNSTANKDVAIDYEHASEQPPTSGSIPAIGAPATGHIRKLEVRNGELWGLVEWGTQARQQIREGAYRFLSPAIRFNSKDRVSGERIGAVLSSAALTNKPFLDGMAPLAASDVGGEGDELTVFAGGPLAHAPHEYMPAVKRALKLHELSSAMECSDHLDSLRTAFDDNDGDVGMTSEGVDLAEYMHPMRDLVGAKPGDTWGDVFDAVQALIDAAISEHEVEDHDMNDAAPAVALNDEHPKEEVIMAMTAEEKSAFEKLQTQVSELTVKLTAAEAGLSTEKTRADAAESELRTLRDVADNDEVGEIIARCKADGYTEALRPHLLSMLRSNPEAFRAMPKHKRPLAPEKARLLTEVTPPERRENPTIVMAEIANETVSQTTNRLMKTQNMSYSQALASASAMHGSR